MAVVVMVVSAALIILVVRYGLVAGIDLIANVLHWSPKSRGQVTGFATSVPELVCLVAAGLSGVWEAGLWNIASSNIINAVLMTVAVLAFRQFNELFNRRFADEVAFAAVAIVIPLVLMYLAMDRHRLVIPVLFACFVIYRVLDRLLNSRLTPGPPGSVGRDSST
ncbi:MAG: hypothetical protein HN348_31260, partial [Proteobacteria bacterium]|nr:hypothetical protein [Pseudomonadota bacterium]